MNRGEHSEGERNNEGKRARARKGTQTLPSVYTIGEQRHGRRAKPGPPTCDTEVTVETREEETRTERRERQENRTQCCEPWHHKGPGAKGEERQGRRWEWSEAGARERGGSCAERGHQGDASTGRGRRLRWRPRGSSLLPSDKGISTIKKRVCQ